MARSGAVNGSATMRPTAAGIALDRAWAVDGPAVPWVAGGPAGRAARIGPRPLPRWRLVGWRRMRRGDVDRRRLGRWRRVRRGLDHGRPRRRVGQENRRRGQVDRRRGSRRYRRDHHRNRHSRSRGRGSRGKRKRGNRSRGHRSRRRRCARGWTQRLGRHCLRSGHRPRGRHECLLDRGDEALDRGGQQTDRRADSERQGYFQRQRRADAGDRQRSSGQQARPATRLVLSRSAGPRAYDDGWGTGIVVRRGTVGDAVLAYLGTCAAEVFGQDGHVNRTRPGVLRVGQRRSRRCE